MTTPELAISHVQQSIDKALRGESKLDADVLNVRGFSTSTMRHIFNNLCSPPVKTYLECGAFCGGSACAAAANNKELTSVIVENFSQDFSEQHVRDTLLTNLAAVAMRTGKLSLIEQDCFTICEKDFYGLKFDVFFFDGKHDFEPQAKALPWFIEAMSPVFCFIVDDFQWGVVRDGTVAGFAAIADKIKIHKSWDLVGEKKQDDAIWHNGVGIWVIERI